MKDKFWKDMLAVIGFFAVVIGGFVFLFSWQNNRIHQSGEAAFRMGVPAQANPYTGRDPMSANVWLNGWMTAKAQERKND